MYCAVFQSKAGSRCSANSRFSGMPINGVQPDNVAVEEMHCNEVIRRFAGNAASGNGIAAEGARNIRGVARRAIPNRIWEARHKAWHATTARYTADRLSPLKEKGTMPARLNGQVPAPARGFYVCGDTVLLTRCQGWAPLLAKYPAPGGRACHCADAAQACTVRSLAVKAELEEHGRSRMDVLQKRL